MQGIRSLARDGIHLSKIPRVVLIPAVILLTLAAVSAVSYVTSKLSTPNLWDAQGEPSSLRFSPDYQVMATTGFLTQVSLWASSSKQLLHILGDFREHTQIAFAPDGNTLAWSNEEYVLFYSLESERLFSIPAKAKGDIYAMVISPAKSVFPDTNILATGGRVSGDGKSAVELWNILDTDALHYTVAEFQSAAVFSLGFSQDGNLLAAGLSDGTLGVWRVSTNELQDQFQASQVLTATSAQQSVDVIAISPDNQVIAAGNTGIGVVLLSVQDGRILKRISADLQSRVLVFSPDSQYLAAGQRSPGFESDSTIDLWRVSDGTRVWSSDAHSGFVADLRFPADGKELIAGYSDGTLQKYTLP